MKNKKLNLFHLTILVMNSILGIGIFSLPQNIAQFSSAFALIITWIITSIGIISITISLVLLSKFKPNLDGGIYSYAKSGFGNTVGFLSAWGYWISAIISNISYLLIFFSSLMICINIFTINFLKNTNQINSFIVESIFLWSIHLIILHGIKITKLIYNLSTIAKLLPLIIFIFFNILNFDKNIFYSDFYGIEMNIPILEQIQNTVLIILWLFIGIEGAIVISRKSKKKKFIGYATLLAVFFILLLYIIITFISIGNISRSNLALIENPSIITILINQIGKYGKIIITFSFIFAMCSSYLTWMILAIEIPYLASLDDIFPKIFSLKNKNDIPYYSLWITNFMIQFSLMLIHIFKYTNYTKLLTIASEIILIPYIFVSSTLIKISFNKKKILTIFVGFINILYFIWLIYSSKLIYLFLSFILYLIGFFLFFIKKKYFL
ncbi:MAG: amino acid permease [Arsenophonus sp.]|nr:MAG: amino acid permease [Arsenophonus sp.]